MKKNWIKFISFMLILTAMLVCFDQFVFVEKSYATSYNRFYKEEENTLDYVVIGNSTVHEGIDPLLIWHEKGLTGYNISNEPTHPEVIILAINEIARTQKPKVVYIDINGLTYQKKSDQEKFVKDYVSDIPKCEARDNITKNYPYLGDIKTTKSKKEIFAGHNEFRKPKYWNTRFSDSLNYSKGFDPRYSTQKQKFYEIDKTKTLSLPADGQEYLTRILETCKQYPNIEFIFGRMPRFSDNKVANEIYKLRSAIPAITECGYKYVDWEEYNSEIGLDPNTDFRDINHMNFNGSQKFTKFFISYLESEYDFSTITHSQKTIDNFNYCYKKYLKK